MEYIESNFAKMECGKRSQLMITFHADLMEIHTSAELMEMNSGFLS